MKHIAKFVVLVVCILTTTTTAAFAARDASLPQYIEQIIHRYNPNVNISVYAESLNTGAVIYQKNAGQMLTPASSLKTLTAAAALEQLGQDYSFQTQALATAPAIHQGALNGNVYFRFDGDPTLHRNDLDTLVKNFVQKGLHVIQGDVYIDTSIFDQNGEAPGWLDEDRNYCYAAPIAAASLDRNCLPITVAPARKTSAKPRVINYGNASNIINYLTAAGGAGCKLSIDGDNFNSYTFTGCVSTRSRPINIGVAVRNPALFAQQTITNILAQNNIRVAGGVKAGTTPNNVKLYLLSSHSSAPLSAIIKTMLKKSDNLFANSLYKKLGYVSTGTPGSWTNGYQAIKNILRQSNINFGQVKMVDGSGLSRDDAISARQLVELLKYTYRNDKIRDPFFHSLGISGIDGHLQNRMPKLKNRVHAKTGTMHGITSLAGYIYANNNQVIAFAIIVNNFTESVYKYQRLEDMICTALAQAK